MRNLLLVSLIAACAGTTLASAQTYPVRPIRVIVPGSPGSANDFTARAIAQRLTDVDVLVLAFPPELHVDGLLGVNVLGRFRATFAFDRATLVLR